MLDVESWIESLPAGVLNQWLAWDKVEPMGEAWMQTASLIQAVNLPLYARAGQEIPDADAFMPDRYKRPKKRLSDQLFVGKQNSESIASKLKGLFGFAKGSK